MMRREILLLGLALTACGGSVDSQPFAAGAQGNATGAAGQRLPGDGGAGLGGSGASGPAAAGGAAGSSYVEPACPEQPRPVVEFGCQPFSGGNGCGPGEGCYPDVSYPSRPCQPESYRFSCSQVGSGSQWSHCEGDSDCASGHSCVVSSLGTSCSQLCPLEGRSGCPFGLFCEPIDVPGVGACF